MAAVAAAVAVAAVAAVAVVAVAVALALAVVEPAVALVVAAVSAAAAWLSPALPWQQRRPRRPNQPRPRHHHNRINSPIAVAGVRAVGPTQRVGIGPEGGHIEIPGSAFTLTLSADALHGK